MANEVAKLIFKADTSDIEKAIKRLGYLKGAANDAEKEVGELGKDAKKAADGVDKLGDEAKQSGKQVDKLGKAAGTAKGKLVGMAVSIVSVASGMAFMSKFTDVNRQFAVMSAQLVTATGSASAAAKEFDRLKDFAATTPFDLAQSVDGFVKLKNLGLDPSEESMRSFGNTAAAMGKDLNQMIEAVADASTMEFERLKEFGIKARQEGSNVSFTFQGVTTTVKKNAAEITGYLKDIGNEKFGTAMSAQAASFAGALSNLQDTFDNLFREAGEGGAALTMQEAVRGITESLGTPEAIAGAQALAQMFANMASVGASSLAAILQVVGAATTKPSEQQGAFTSGEELLAMSVKREGLTPEEAKLREKIADAEQKMADAHSLRGYKIAANDVAELNQELANLRSTYIPFQATAFDSLGGILQDPTGRFNITAEAQVDGSPAIPLAPEGESAAEIAKKAEIDALKQLDLDFQAYLDDKKQTALDLKIEEYENELSIAEDHKNNMLDIEKKLENDKLSIKETAMNGGIALLGKGLKRMLGDSKAAAVAGVAIDAAMGAAKIIIGGSIQAQSIQASYAQLAVASGNPAIAKIGVAEGAAALAASKALAVKTAAVQFGLGSIGVAMGGGGGGGGSTGASAAAQTPVQEAANDEIIQAPQAINVTVDGSIDPEGARRIIEAINEATEDGLEINALVGS